MKKFVNGQYLEMTEEDIAELKVMQRKFEAEERARPMTTEEVSQLLIKQQINTLPVDNNTALRMKNFYPKWADLVGTTIENAGFKFTHKDKLWATVQANYTVQAHYEPGTMGMESLFTEVCETHAGTEEDPIPYNNNMVLENGKYYMQDYILYMCNRDSGNPVYNPLAELVGLYVEVI